MNFLLAELDRLQACINQHLDARGHGGGEAEIVGGGHAVHHGARLVAAGDGADDGALIGHGGAASQLILAGLIVETAVDPTQIACGGEALQGLVDCGAAAKVGKIAGRPDLVRAGGDPGEQPGAKVGIMR
jgi:hypothetical protein